ncbi:hypothetical protein Mgra_00003738 [Meloidogyne graminicola]|uniref:Uncharacterized protein n=1 Tax=Meloidogyne graminicola TaxID=189291 RepID=A0A8S9ZSX7_9BILA|nr:hypothetical protein Mgra_00003738 [Meloidogyne graminicola]
MVLKYFILFLLIIKIFADNSIDSNGNSDSNEPNDLQSNDMQQILNSFQTPQDFLDNKTFSEDKDNEDNNLINNTTENNENEGENEEEGTEEEGNRKEGNGEEGNEEKGNEEGNGKEGNDGEEGNNSFENDNNLNYLNNTSTNPYNEENENNNNSFENQSGQYSCVYEDGTVTENGNKRNLSNDEQQQIEEYFNKMREYEEQMLKDSANFMQNLGQFVKNQFENIFGSSGKSVLPTGFNKLQNKASEPPTIPCLCNNCDNVMLIQNKN